MKTFIAIKNDERITNCLNEIKEANRIYEMSLL